MEILKTQLDDNTLDNLLQLTLLEQGLDQRLQRSLRPPLRGLGVGVCEAQSFCCLNQRQARERNDFFSPVSY